MKKLRSFTWLLFFALAGTYCYSQYSISGYINAPNKNKRVYLSLIQYDEHLAISKDQVLISTLTDSTGYFNFTGKLLPTQHKLYRIHANLEEGTAGLDIADTDEIKNFHNFIFSNTDTIVFEKSEGPWFSFSKNTNFTDQEWRTIRNYKRKLSREFSGTKNKEAKTQSSSQFLSVLKTHVQERNTHPLVQLILLSEIQETILEQDFEKDDGFYFELKSQLNDYYGNSSYALQFEDLVSNLSKSTTQRQLDFYKRATYTLSFVVLAMAICIIFLVFKLKRGRKNPVNEPINLTKQEEKVADLIVQGKTNKEIAAELFISLSNVKTHIRNLYTKFEVSNRQQFTDKIKNHPRD